MIRWMILFFCLGFGMFCAYDLSLNDQSEASPARIKGVPEDWPYASPPAWIDSTAEEHGRKASEQEKPLTYVKPMDLDEAVEAAEATGKIEATETMQHAQTARTPLLSRLVNKLGDLVRLLAKWIAEGVVYLFEVILG